MMANQVMRSAHASDCGRIVFVYRDPVERIVSLYKNKFIARDGFEDLFEGYEELTGEAPGQATFRSFVNKYLRPNFRELDLHVLPQSLQLKRFYYTDAIPIGDLHTGMIDVIGEDLADQYFAKPVNTTHQQKAVDVPNCVDIPSDELAAELAQSGTMPSNDSFRDDAIRARLLELYADDVRMISGIEASG